MPRLGFIYTRNELSNMGLPVIVEQYKHKNYGKGRRAYLEEFTEKERKVISRWHMLIYKWYLVKGYPEHFTFRKVESIHLLKRAVNFFGGI